MGRNRGGKQPEPSTSGARREGPVLREGTYKVDQGWAELVRDQDLANGWLLKLNGVQSSHIDMDDPSHLAFEYMRWIAALVEDRWAEGHAGRVRLLHLGGAGCSLARYFHSIFPEARQVVVELDGALAGFAREWFDLPRAPQLRVRVGEGRAVTETLSHDSRDVIIRDVFADGLTPDPLTTAEFTRTAFDVLGPEGIYVVNSGSGPDLKTAREEMATIGSVFPYLAVIADSAMLKGRRWGNVIIAGSKVPFAGSAELTRTLLGGGVPAQYKDDDWARDFARDALIRRDEVSLFRPADAQTHDGGAAGDGAGDSRTAGDSYTDGPAS